MKFLTQTNLFLLSLLCGAASCAAVTAWSIEASHDNAGMHVTADFPDVTGVAQAQTNRLIDCQFIQSDNGPDYGVVVTDKWTRMIFTNGAVSQICNDSGWTGCIIDGPLPEMWAKNCNINTGTNVFR